MLWSNKVLTIKVSIMKDEAQNKLVIPVSLNGKSQEVTIEEGESSDGAPFYYCDLNGERITQIRKDDHDNWKQLWGDLDEASVKSIGEAIDKNNK